MQKILMLVTRKKWWVIAMVIFLAGSTYAYQSYQASNKPVPVGRPYKVALGDITSAVSATGTLSPVNSVDVSSKINGRITEVRVNENDMVKTGQIIIVLDDRQLSAQAAQSRAKLTNAEASYLRTKRLADIGALSQQQLDADRTNYEVAKAAFDDIASNLDDTIIRAPIDGMVIGKPIPAGQTVAPGISNPMVLLTVADMGKMQILALIDESDIGQVKLGQKVAFTVDAYPEKTFSGTVTIISNKANVQQNVVYYTVYIDVDSPQGLLKPTMTARVSVNIGERKNVVVIPILAIKDNKGQRFVQVVGSDGQTQSIKITTGMSSTDQIEVLSGLNPGDTLMLPQAKGAATTAAPGGPGGVNIFRQTPSR